jgi:hypothetical protein
VCQKERERESERERYEIVRNAWLEREHYKQETNKPACRRLKSLELENCNSNQNVINIFFFSAGSMNWIPKCCLTSFWLREQQVVVSMTAVIYQTSTCRCVCFKELIPRLLNLQQQRRRCRYVHSGPDSF